MNPCSYKPKKELPLPSPKHRREEFACRHTRCKADKKSSVRPRFSSSLTREIHEKTVLHKCKLDGEDCDQCVEDTLREQNAALRQELALSKAKAKCLQKTVQRNHDDALTLAAYCQRLEKRLERVQGDRKPPPPSVMIDLNAR